MKKIVPCHGFVLITFEPDGEFKMSAETLISQKKGLVVEVGEENREIKTGDVIYFTQYTGNFIPTENSIYAFVNYSDILGKETK